ncbi:MAG: ATP-binding cassette domain-containing protein, partial [Arenicellales bacterium]|nr:ATP-binding cassette domain-containing protein [Arenicellales bacterium]
PWSGKVLLDGIDRTEIPRSVIVSSLAVVSQDIFLFEGTIRDNLTLWDSTIPDDTLIRACTDAEILETVLALQGGLDGKVIEGGANLSGGQCQRLEIARALVRN